MNCLAIKPNRTPIIQLGSVIKQNQTHNKILPIEQNWRLDYWGPVKGGGGGGMDVPGLNFKPYHVTILEGSCVAVTISWNIGMSLSELCLIIRTKNRYACPHTATGATKMAEKSVKRVVIVFYFFKCYTTCARLSCCWIFRWWNSLSLSYFFWSLSHSCSNNLVACFYFISLMSLFHTMLLVKIYPNRTSSLSPPLLNSIEISNTTWLARKFNQTLITKQNQTRPVGSVYIWLFPLARLFNNQTHSILDVRFCLITEYKHN